MSSDLFGSISRRKQHHRLSLARRKRREPAAKQVQCSVLQTRCAISLDTAYHRVEECLVFEGVGKKVHSVGFRRSNRRPHVVLSGKKNHACFASGLGQPELKIEPAHSR
jgi:hypothetical protein